MIRVNGTPLAILSAPALAYGTPVEARIDVDALPYPIEGYDPSSAVVVAHEWAWEDGITYEVEIEVFAKRGDAWRTTVWVPEWEVEAR